MGISQRLAPPAPHPLAEILMPLLHGDLAGRQCEYAVVAATDRGGRLLAYHLLSDGTCDQVAGIVQILRKIIANDAVFAIIVAHNHPCGTAFPSSADLAVTRRIAAFTRLAGVELADHILFAGDETLSFRAQGWL